MNILLTGSSGFIGSNLLDFFYKNKNKIFIYSYNQKKFEKIKKNYKDIENFKNIRKKIKFDCVIHCAAPNDIKSNANFEYSINSYIKFTNNFLEKIKKYKIEKFIYLSTAQVYGRNLRNNVKENKKCLTVNNYGLFHKFCEDLIINFSTINLTKKNYYILRISNVLGNTKFYNKEIFRLLPNDICKNLKTFQTAKLRSSGQQYRNFISIYDLVNVINKMTIGKNINSGIYNVSGRNMKVISLIKIIQSVYEEKFKKKANIIIENNKNPGPKKLNYNSDKLKSVCKLKSSNNFKKCINDIFDLN